jgi:hypothetical protein
MPLEVLSTRLKPARFGIVAVEERSCDDASRGREALVGEDGLQPHRLFDELHRYETCFGHLVAPKQNAPGASRVTESGRVLPSIDGRRSGERWLSVSYASVE